MTSWSGAGSGRSSARSTGPSGRASAGSSSDPNGSGKTTLLSVIGLDLWPTAGTVDVLGARYGQVDSREIRRRIGVSGSAVEGTLRADLTPITLVMTARYAATEPWWHVYTDEDRARAMDLLVGLGLAGVAEHAYGTLSEGERRRTSIARALMPDPDLLLLDEPAASLDLGAREILIGDVAQLAAPGAPDAPSCWSPITSRRSRPGSPTPSCWPTVA